MATWDDVQRTFQEKIDEIEKVTLEMLTNYKEDLEKTIKEAKENEIFDMLSKVNQRLSKIEQRLEEKDNPVDDDGSALKPKVR